MELPRNLIKLPSFLNFLRIFWRASMSGCNDYCGEEIIKDKNKKQKKITVLKKCFPKNSKDSAVILEAKDASSVIKRLNWEFKTLYGTIRSPKSTVIKTLESDNTIIQNRTVFPILDPKIGSATKIKLETNVKNDTIEDSYWQTLLKFPLLSHQSPAVSSDLEICEMNSLRKVLEEKSESYIPSVSRILEKTMPQEQVENLRRWKENLIKELGEDGFQKYQNEILSNGQTFHTCINNYLANVPRTEIEIDEAIAGHWESLKTIFHSVSDVKLMEERITHPFLRYRGIVDCFAQYKGNLVVIEWKTSKKKKPSLSSTFDNPLQIAAYVGALNFDPKHQYLANKGLIVVAYQDGSKASTHFMNENVMLHYWKEWLARVKLYWELTEKEDSHQT